MPRSQQPSTPDAPPPSTPPATSPHENAQTDGLGNKVAAVAVVGLAAALIEAELIPGMIIGAAAVLAPSIFPRFSSGLRPLVKSAVRAGYSIVEKTRETVAEASEQLQDIMAEVRAEENPVPDHPAEAAAAPTPAPKVS